MRGIPSGFDVPCSTPRFHRGEMFRLKEHVFLTFENYNSHFNVDFEILCENWLEQYTEQFLQVFLPQSM